MNVLGGLGALALFDRRPPGAFPQRGPVYRASRHNAVYVFLLPASPRRLARMERRRSNPLSSCSNGRTAGYSG